MKNLLTTESKSYLNNLSDLISSYGRCLIAFSGGVDSTFLGFIANKVLGKNSLMITAKSPSLDNEELKNSLHLAKNWKWNHRIIDTKEFSNPNYTKNNLDRCFFCKEELFKVLSDIAIQEGFNFVLDGSNLDDLNDFRPGMKASSKYGVKSPLVEVGLTKEMIRTISKHFDIPTWDKPSQPCLSSRIPYGTTITPKILEEVSRSEKFLKSLGYKVVRVRHHGSIARIEVPEKDYEKLLDNQSRDLIVKELKKIGFKFITFDLLGFRTGSLNNHV